MVSIVTEVITYPLFLEQFMATIAADYTEVHTQFLRTT
jgi:hypothetical protein